ncbi:Gfo/Idh/MocA family protein [Jiangella endophytica]|uniref:Gfo/Idh/MocA family protein n=1 Tax=Jiangella endophytica TaxID=1623398 RepID=UPI000E345D0E|nr:Gfo/Idh/MocA family oxidoreductase [Jiangella endophytica]
MIRVGVAGAAGVGAAHVAALRRLDGVEVVAVSGSTRESAERVAGRLGVPAAFGSERALIDAGIVDALHVCTPNDRHAPAVRAAFAAGLHVVCEKPLATTAADAAELAVLAAAAPTSSTVCYHYRYSPLAVRLAGLVRSGLLGTIHSVRASYLQNWQLGAAASWRNDPARSGSSRVLADIGSHALDLVEVLTGQPITSIGADFHTPRHDVLRPGTDDVAVALARLGGGGVIALTASQVSPGHLNTITIEIDGDEGTAAWELGDRETLELVRTADARRLRLDGHADPHRVSRFWRTPVDAEARVVALFDAFYRPLLGGAGGEAVAPLPTFADAARHVALVDEAARPLLTS